MPQGSEERNDLAQVARLASELGPALAPVGHDELLQILTDLARSLFDAAACSIAVLDEDEETLTFRAAAGAGADEIVGKHIQVGEGIAGWVMASEQSATVEEPALDPRFAADVAAATGFIPRVIHAIPLTTKRALVGVLEILDPGPLGPTGARQNEILSLFGRQAALAIEEASVFSNLGRSLLEALSGGAEEGLRSRLGEVAKRAPRSAGEFQELTQVIRHLALLGPEEREAAVSILTSFVDYARSRRHRS